MIGKRLLLVAIVTLTISSARAICPYDANCMNNPVTGRNPASPQGGAIAPPFGQYSSHPLNQNFGSDPLRNGGIGNPYAPRPKTTNDSEALTSPPFSGSGSASSGSNSGLQGVDPDLRR